MFKNIDLNIEKMAGAFLPTPEQLEQQPSLRKQLFVRNEQFSQTARSILSYIQASSDLSVAQTLNLYFHAGQMFAFANKKQEAIACFNNAIVIEDIEGTLKKWNDYVRGIIAFLNDDKEALKQHIQNILKGRMNQDFIVMLGRLQNMFNNMGRSYFLVYQMPTEDKFCCSH